jgi:hypothetical protein
VEGHDRQPEGGVSANKRFLLQQGDGGAGSRGRDGCADPRRASPSNQDLAMSERTHGFLPPLHLPKQCLSINYSFDKKVSFRRKPESSLFNPAHGRDFKAAHNFTSGADIARYMSNRIKLVQDLISFFVKLNMAETSITFSSRMSYLGVYLTRTPP